MPKTIQNKSFDEERSLYALDGAVISNCKFSGPKDGESALKESSNIEVEESIFDLRYPLWHSKNFKVTETFFSETCRAPIWYAKDGTIAHSKIQGVKAIRECENILIDNCTMISTEFGWKNKGITVLDSKIQSEYLLFESKNVTIRNVLMKGKYSFQYIDNLVIEDSEFDTKDAFWHSKNVIVKNSIINGEYLGWFAENITFINCTIKGTQPFCYCKGLKLIDCKMIDCDLAFEYSEVEASIIGKVDSIKNPLKGKIIVDEIGEIIKENAVYDCACEIIVRK